jgi:hypothetical protein
LAGLGVPSAVFSGVLVDSEPLTNHDNDNDIKNDDNSVILIAIVMIIMMKK